MPVHSYELRPIDRHPLLIEIKTDAGKIYLELRHDPPADPLLTIVAAPGVTVSGPGDPAPVLLPFPSPPHPGTPSPPHASTDPAPALSAEDTCGPATGPLVSADQSPLLWPARVRRGFCPCPRIPARMPTASPRFRLNLADLKSLAKGALIAAAGAAATYATQWVSGLDFGTAGPVVAAGLAVLVNAIKKLTDAPQ